MKPDVPRLGPDPLAGHLASRLTRLLPNLCMTLLLAASALPVFAQQLPTSSLAADSADQPSAVTRSMLPEAMGMTDRTLLLASDLSRSQGQPLLADVPGAPVQEEPEAEDGHARNVLQKALALLGTPYRWGGNSPERGFDCSGLVKYVFSHALGIELPRVSREQARNGEAIKDREEMAAGDLVFFGRRGRVDHVGIYLGEGRFVHAPSRGKAVSVSRLDGGYWGRKFMQARRIEGI